VSTRRSPAHLVRPGKRVSRFVRGSHEEAEQVLALLCAGNVTEGETFSVRLSADLAMALRRRAAADREPLAGVIRQALEAWLGAEPS
jgi:hypothetical protein